MPPRAGQRKGGAPQEKRQDPTDPRSKRRYTRDEFNTFYGPVGGPAMWKKAGSSGAPPPLRPVRGASPRAARGGYYIGAKVKATGRLKGDQGQIVHKGAVGKVTALPGRGTRLEPGAVAEVRISGVTFDATRDMIQLVTDRVESRPQKPRLAPVAARKPAAGKQERRRDPTMKAGQKGADKTYTRDQFDQFYGKDAGKKMWKKAGKSAGGAKPQAQGPEKRADPTMKPGQKGAGKTYTKEQFDRFYGKADGKKMWVKAGKGAKAGKPAGPERRRDPTMKAGQKGADKTYTKDQFVQFYGKKDAKKLWDKAGKGAAPKKAKKGAPTGTTAAERRPDPTVKKGQKEHGKTYTKDQFVQFYGKKNAAKLWEKAGKGIEKRADPTVKSKTSYTKEQFVAFYGESAGAKLWKIAGKGKKAAKKDGKEKKAKKEKPKREFEEVTVKVTRKGDEAVGWERHTRSQTIVAVAEGSPAAAAGLAKSMKIRKVAGKDVKTDADVKAALADAGAEFEVVCTRPKPKEVKEAKEAPAAEAAK